jgi:hypothetical protein
VYQLIVHAIRRPGHNSVSFKQDEESSPTFSANFHQLLSPLSLPHTRSLGKVARM